MDSYRPPTLGEPTAAVETPPAWAQSLAKILHLEWCQEEGDWRPLGHTDAKPGIIGQLEEEEQYPTIG